MRGRVVGEGGAGRGRVVVVGSINVDLVVRGPRLPAPGETVSGGSFEQHDGGKGANQAVAAARLGRRVAFVGAVGRDELGVRATRALAAEGVDVGAVLSLSDAPTGVALILVAADGENLIGVAPGANTAFGAPEVETALRRVALDRSDVVLVSNEIGHGAALAALRAGRSAGATTILNPAPADGVDRAMLEQADVVTPNRGELRALAAAVTGREPEGGSDAEDIARGLRTRLVGSRPGPAEADHGPTVVVTLGAEGALLVDGAGTSQARPPVVTVVDATGAGDAFNGCLAAAIAEGRSLRDALPRAVAAGALATTRAGAREGMPTTDALEAALASG